MEWIALWTFIVNCGICIVNCVVLATLFWYALETKRIRKASQQQVEALQKPCLALVSEPRDFDDTVLEMDDAVGGMIVASGNVKVENIGNGPAVNVRFKINPADRSADSNAARSSGYLQNISQGKTVVMPVSTRGFEKSEV
jgi:hypothetical protein